MKSAGIIYRQYRQARKLAFIRALAAARTKSHENCHYSACIQYMDVDGTDKTVKLCLLRPDSMDVCTNPRDCNAFARRWTDDKVAEEFNKLMSEGASRKKMFPELWAYEWVLDKSLNEARQIPGPLAAIIVWVISLLESMLRAIGGDKRLME